MKLRTCTELDAESIRLVLDSNAFLNATSELLLLPLKMFANVRLSLILTVTCVYCMHRSLSPRQNLSATMPHGGRSNPVREKEAETKHGKGGHGLTRATKRQIVVDNCHLAVLAKSAMSAAALCKSE
jgi:hypothetical protein